MCVHQFGDDEGPLLGDHSCVVVPLDFLPLQFSYIRHSAKPVSEHPKIDFATLPNRGRFPTNCQTAPLVCARESNEFFDWPPTFGI